MKFCSACGQQSEDAAAFCAKCGAALPKPVISRSSIPINSSNLPGTEPLGTTPISAKATGPNGCGIAIGIVVLLAIFGAILSNSGNNSKSDGAVATSANSRATQVAQHESATAHPVPTKQPRPTATPESYEHQVKREKYEFLQSVDESISAANIAGNPTKYEGENVDLHCTVSNVVQQGVFNASCGDDDTNLVIKYDDTNSLDQGQAVRILGTVDEPSEGTNAYGVYGKTNRHALRWCLR